MSTILIISILLVPALSIQYYFVKPASIRIDELILGFFYFIIFITLASIILPENLAKTDIFAKTILTLSTVLFLWNIKKYFSKFHNFWIISVLFILLFIYGYFNLLTLRFHASPDNHGFAATVGYLSENFSYDLLVDKYHSITGLYRPKFDGPPNYYNSATWSIADSQLRWTAETILTVGRIGLPLLGSLVNSISDPLISFPRFIVILGIFGSFCIAYLFIELFKISYYAISNREVSKSKWCEAIALLVIALSNWQVIYIVEGTVNQIFLILGVQFHLLYLLKLYISEKFQEESVKSKIVYLSAGPLFISVVYPHGFLLLLTISAPILLFIAYKGIKNVKKQEPILAILTTLACLPAIFYLLNEECLLVPLKMYANGIAGMPYNLGNPSLYSYLIGASYEWYPDNIGSFSFSGQSVSNMNYSLIFFCIFTLLTSIANYFLCRKRQHYFLAITTIIFLPLISIIKCVFFSNFSTYIYSRHCVVFAVIGLPMLCALTHNIINRIKAFKINIYISIFLMLLFQAIYDLKKFSTDFNLHSKPFNIISSKDDLLEIEPQNSIIVSNKPMGEIFSLTLLSPIYYLTDDWSPIMKKSYFNQSDISIYEVEIFENQAQFKKIGSLILDKELRGPLNKNQLVSHPNYIPINNN